MFRITCDDILSVMRGVRVAFGHFTVVPFANNRANKLQATTYSLWPRPKASCDPITFEKPFELEMGKYRY